MKKHMNKKNAVRVGVVGIGLTVASMFYTTGCGGGGGGDGGGGGGTSSMCSVPLEASLNTQVRIGGATTAVEQFSTDSGEWTLFNIANELRATKTGTTKYTEYHLEVEGMIRDIEIVKGNDNNSYALLAMGAEGIATVNITDPTAMILVSSVKVNYYHEGIWWTEGGGDIVPDNSISSTRGPVSSLAVYNEGNATVPSMQLLIGDEGYGVHKTALENLFDGINGREADGTLKIDQEVYTLQYAGENPWGGPKSLTLYGEGNNTRLFVAQGFLGMGIYNPKTLEQVGHYNLYTDATEDNGGEDWFINMDVSTEVQSGNIDVCTGMPDYNQANYEIQQVWHNKVDAPTPWADFDRYGKFYYDARKIDVATFGSKTTAYIAYGLGGMVAVDVTGYDTATARSADCTTKNNFLEGMYLGYVPGLPAHGPDAETGQQSQSLFPYFGVGMLKEAGVVDVKVDTATKNVYFSDHFAGLMVIGNADNPSTWHGNKGAGSYDNDTMGTLGDHWPDYEFVTSYDMTPFIPTGKEEEIPTFITETPILLATGEVSGHGNVFGFTSTFDSANNVAIDIALAAGGGGLNFMDVLITGAQSSNSFEVPVHFATTDEIGAAADGSPTQEINIGHAEGLTAYDNLLFLGDGPHGMSVWQIADEECNPTDDVHLVANTLQSEYPVGDINPAPHAHDVVLDHATNSALVMSQSRGVRRIENVAVGTVGAPVLLYPKNTDIYEHNVDAGNVADFLSMQDHAYSAALKGPLAFTADGSNGLTVYDLSKDPTDSTNSNGFVVANIGGDTNSQPDLGRASDVALWDDTSTGTSYAFVAAGSRGIAVVDITNAQENNMRLVKIFEPIKWEDTKAGKADGKSVAVKVVGNHAFFTYDSFGVVCYSIADLIAPLPAGVDPQDIWTPGTVGYRPEATARFKLQNREMFGRAELAEWSGGAAGMDVVSVNGRYIFYIAYGDAGVIKINWTNPATPVLMEHADTVGFASDVTVINGHAYVADGGGGLVLLK
ncbi:hypothetical protein TSL6_05350 [Sulfurovum sp. TSL6]|uniref:hypothetical protein n=1 Tax=Sulfurovum sp. TSL6 TaxID=2826995 RepID=UPI001CC3F96C|nr:hypothetical protein [Sulfurovum sp. TSL6]GIU00029.1 hypothetical protein TSL6_05350 [Sulfurovum sp. TSL6]